MPFWLQLELGAAGGWLPWETVMRQALYHPEHGYYAGKPRRVGRAGDFYTAVSTGPLYGRLLAEQAAACWEAQGRPDAWCLAEQAAHDGQLMADVLTALQQQHPEVASRTRVVLVEPQAGYRAVQKECLGSVWGGDLRWVAGVEDLPGGKGLFFSNELLDALPVHRVRWEGGAWRELGVALVGDQLAWESREITTAALRAEVERLAADLPEGFVTEMQLAVLDWLRALAGCPFEGEVWIADYGLDAADYWSAERPQGTLRRYWQHRMDDRVLEALGSADLTCHVNLGRLLEEAQAVGFSLLENRDQGTLLTRLAAPWLQSLEGRPPDPAARALLRQFQTLTHPGLMGRAFRVLRLACPSAISDPAARLRSRCDPP